MGWMVRLNSALYWSTKANGLFSRPRNQVSPKLYFPAVHSFQSFR